MLSVVPLDDIKAQKRFPDLTLSVSYPDFVEQFHHLLVDDENDGHVQAHPAQPGDSPLVKPAGRGQERQRVPLRRKITALIYNLKTQIWGLSNILTFSCRKTSFNSSGI